MVEENKYEWSDMKKKLYSTINDVDNQTYKEEISKIDKGKRSNNLDIEKIESKSSKLNKVLNNLEFKYKKLKEFDLKNNDFIEDVKHTHTNTIRYLRDNYNLEIWKKSSENTYYYRINPFSKKIKISSNDEFLKLIDEHIKVYENIKDVYLEKNVLILVKSLIGDIKDEVFYPYKSREFFELNEIEYRNTFQYSTFLKNKDSPFNIKGRTPNVKNRFSNIRKKLYNKNFVKKYIYNMFECQKQADYVVAWLSFYFQTLNKSSTAIVLIGDKETTDIFINQIIQPIFAYKKEYFGCINNETLKKSNESILQDKIFYHIDELSKENINDKKTSKIALDILKSNRFTTEESVELEEDYIYGQLIVTSSKNNPYPLLKNCYSRCSVFKVKSLEKILENMKLDRFILEEEISFDLDYFSKVLAQKNTKWYEDKYFPYETFETEEKEVLPYMKNGVLRTKKIENKIKEFILNIQQKNLDYFSDIGNDLFDELKKNFEDNMIAQPLLAVYFNKIYGDEIFLDNSYFLEILKEKSKMFEKTPSDKSKSNGKKRYEIFTHRSVKSNRESIKYLVPK